MDHPILRRLIGICALAVAGAFSTSSHADQPFTASPLGVQRVLVLPIEIPTGVGCPDANAPCPYTQAFYRRSTDPEPLGQAALDQPCSGCERPCDDLGQQLLVMIKLHTRVRGAPAQQREA